MADFDADAAYRAEKGLTPNQLNQKRSEEEREAEAGKLSTEPGRADPREPTRAQLARGLLVLLAFVVAGVFVFIGFGSPGTELLVQTVLPSVVGLAGTALGFYFGASEARSGGSGR